MMLPPVREPESITPVKAKTSGPPRHIFPACPALTRREQMESQPAPEGRGRGAAADGEQARNQRRRPGPIGTKRGVGPLGRLQLTGPLATPPEAIGCIAYVERGYELEQFVRTGSEDEFDILHINIEDIAVTQQLVAAGQHLDIELVDHLVIGNQRFVSLKERLRW